MGDFGKTRKHRTSLVLLYSVQRPHASPPTKASGFSSPPRGIFAVCVYGCKNMLFAMSAGVLGWKWRVVCAFSCFLGLLCGWVVKVFGVSGMGKGGVRWGKGVGVGVCLVDLGDGEGGEGEGGGDGGMVEIPAHSSLLASTTTTHTQSFLSLFLYPLLSFLFVPRSSTGISQYTTSASTSHLPLYLSSHPIHAHSSKPVPWPFDYIEHMQLLW